MHNIDLYPELFDEMMTNKAEKISDLSKEVPVLLVFLRHFGCVFCKEALSDLSGLRGRMEEKNIKLVFIHMSENPKAEEYFDKFNLKGISHISDPFARYYKAFGLMKGNFSQLYGLRTWIKGYAAVRKGFNLELAKSLGDSTQMPGVFLIKDSSIKESYIHKSASDRPNYDQIINCF